jgi:Di-haem oxidoreductase, putative peroxidase
MKWLCFFLIMFGAGIIYGEEPRWQNIPRGNELTPSTAAWFIHHEPEIAVELGRRALTRTWSAREGASPPQAARVLSHEKPPQLGFFPSCTLCHQGNFASGPVVSFGTADNLRTPHLWGVGAKDYVANSIAQQIMTQLDDNKNNVLERSELSGRLLINNGMGQQLDFGSAEDRNSDGIPDSDPVIAWQFFDEVGNVITGGNWRHVQVTSTRPFIQAFGSRPRAGGMTTLRSTIIGAFALHAGLQTYDPIFMSKFPLGITGIPQPQLGVLPDMGVWRGYEQTMGDDADRDGIAQELITGDIDVAEYFLSTFPAPEYSVRDDDPGLALFYAFDCATCHVPHWQVGNFSARGIFTDFRSHQVSDDPTQPRLRTAALWGIAEHKQFGHDGSAKTLDTIIRRHAGDAQHSRMRYESVTTDQQQEIITFLQRMTLSKKK